MTGTLRAAFYKGTHAGAAGLIERLVRWRTRSPYAHVELIFFDGGPGADSQAAAASWLDGGVRFKWFPFDPACWDLIDLPPSLARRALAWFDAHEGDAFDLPGSLRLPVPRRHGRRGWSSAGAVAAALGMPVPARFDPGTLHAALTFLNQSANAGFFRGPSVNDQSQVEALATARIDIARLEVEVGHLTRSVIDLQESNHELTVKLDQVLLTVSEARGGSKTLMVVGGAASSAGAALAWIVQHMVQT